MQATITGLDEIKANLLKFASAERERVSAGMSLISAQNENMGKQDRPWTDRTGNARRSITGSNANDGVIYTSALAIGVTYGRFLECDFGGRFSVVWPTMTKQRQNMLITLAKVAGM